MPQIQNDLLPGKKGVDYHFVSYGGKVYVVYRVKLGGGKTVNVSWRVEKDDMKALGIDGGKDARRISKSAFKSLNVFGSASEIAQGDKDVHPFQQHLKKLKELYGNVSWIDNKEFMSVMLMGYAENWSAEELRQRLTRTSWYQSRTDYQRSWEQMAKAERGAQTDTWRTRMLEALRTDIYGVGMTLDEAGYDMEGFERAVNKVSSGAWGEPNDGFAAWLAGERRKAEKIEGTAAWIERQQLLEEQRGFMNRPEDVFEQIRSEAMSWLGPKGLPDRSTLMGWAEDLVSEKASDGDWQKYLRTQARSLYPWLGPEEKWMDRASVYKNIAEQELGKPIGWDHSLLYKLGATDDAGAFTGQVLSYDDFTRLVRSRNEWWGGDVAKKEGFELFNYLNQTFNGVTA